jgi:uncharacterized SAM-binding protein YcdF (DUF218 family)
VISAGLVTHRGMKRRLRLILRPLLVLALAVSFVITLFCLAGFMLVQDEPHRADAIVIVGGNPDVRAPRAFELARDGYAPIVFLDMETDETYYHTPTLKLAQEWIQTLPPDIASKIRICPVNGATSTEQETVATKKCLDDAGVHSALLVTSNFHSRRARVIFQEKIPSVHFSVASAPDPLFEPHWWRQREWAKTMLAESIKFAWYEVVDRWR